MPNLSDDEFAAIFGGRPDEVAVGLVQFSAAAQLLSSDHPRLIDGHANEWVAICGNTVAASGPSMDSVVSKLRSDGVNPDDAIIRYIDTEERTLIL